MPAKFLEVTPNAGVDEDLPTGGTGIVVPLKGANLVILENGKDMKVAAAMRGSVQVKEVKQSHYPQNLTAQQIANLKSGSFRLFEIGAGAAVGFHDVNAVPKNSKDRNKAVVLKALVVKQKPVVVSIRPVQIGSGNSPSNHSNLSSDGQALVDEMNAIWTPQANVVFTLGSNKPVQIAGIASQSQAVDIQDSSILASLVSNKVKGSDFNTFLVQTTWDGPRNVVNAVTNSKEGVALISDLRSQNTLAHEAGHYLGSLGQGVRYNHPGGQSDIFLMRDGGAGRKIPYSTVTDFNKGYMK